MDAEKSEKHEVTVDDILKILGPFGKFNVLSLMMILLLVLTSGMYSSIYNFESMDVDYRCSVPECNDTSAVNFSIPHENGEPSKCLRYAPSKNISALNSTCSAQHFDTSSQIGCSEYIYLEDHSIVKEFNLACQDWKRTLVGTVHNAGFFVSIPLVGFISDKYGRKLAVIFAAVTNGIFGAIRAISVNYDMFIVFEFLEPALGGGIYTACFVLALELVGPKGRVFVSLLFNIMFIVGGVAVTTLSWWLQSWRKVLLIIYTPSIFAIIYLWTMSESFRWLFSHGLYEKGFNILKKAEKMNGVDVPAEYYVEIEKHMVQMDEAKKAENIESNKSSFRQVLGSIMIWKRLMICSYLWITSTLVYYGLTINAIELSGNSYINYIIILLIEAPANVTKLVCLDRFGRKKVISVAFILSGIILISYGFVPAGPWSIVFYLGGKFFITLAYNSLYVFAAEVFPTTFRTSLLALCSTLGRTGSAVAPQTPLLAKYYKYLPTMLFGAMAASCAFLVLTLPETNNLKLPDSLQDAQDQDKGHEKKRNKNEKADKGEA